MRVISSSRQMSAVRIRQNRVFGKLEGDSSTDTTRASSDQGMFPIERHIKAIIQ